MFRISELPLILKYETIMILISMILILKKESLVRLVD